MKLNTATIAAYCKQLGLPAPEFEYKFALPRRWAFDLCWPAPYFIALEIEGGVFMPGGGRHTRGAGYRRDLEKYNRAAVMGYRVLRCLPEQFKSGAALELVAECVIVENKHES